MRILHYRRELLFLVQKRSYYGVFQAMVDKVKSRELIPNSCDLSKHGNFEGIQDIAVKSPYERYTCELSSMDLSSDMAKSIFMRAIDEECFGLTAGVPVFSWIKKRCGGIALVDPFYLRALLLKIGKGGIHCSGHLSHLYYEAVASERNIKLLEENAGVVDAFLIGLSRFSDRRNFDQLWAYRLSKHPNTAFDDDDSQNIIRNVTISFDRQFSSFIASEIKRINSESDGIGVALSRSHSLIATEINLALRDSNIRLFAHLVRDEYLDECRHPRLFRRYRNKLTSMYFDLGSKLWVICAKRNCSIQEGLTELKQIQLRYSLPAQANVLNQNDILDVCLDEKIFGDHGLHLINAPFYEVEKWDPFRVTIQLPTISMQFTHISQATLVLDCIGRSRNPKMHAILDDFMEAMPEMYSDENIHISYWEALCRLGRIEDALRSFERYFSSQFGVVQPSMKARQTIWSFIQKANTTPNVIKNWENRLDQFTFGQPKCKLGKIIKTSGDWKYARKII